MLNLNNVAWKRIRISNLHGEAILLSLHTSALPKYLHLIIMHICEDIVILVTIVYFNLILF